MSDSTNPPALEARVEQLTAELHRLHTHTAAREAVRTAVPTATPDDLEVLVPQVDSRLRAADDPAPWHVRDHGARPRRSVTRAHR